MLTFIYNNLLGLFMGQYKDHKSGLSFDSYRELRDYRIENYPLDYVYGKPFFMCEVSFTKEQQQILSVSEEEEE